MSEEASLAALVRMPDLSAAEKRERLIQLVVDSVASPHSRRAYRSGLEQFFRWWQETAEDEPFGRALVQRYRSHLEARGCAPATINRQLAPIRKLAEEAALTGLLPSAVASQVQRLKGAKRLGVRTGSWLAREQAQQLLSLPDRNSLCGKRDAALLSLLLGAGLRREELAQLKIEDLQQREGRWCLVDIEGKGKRIRTVPIPAWTKAAVDAWLQVMPFSSGLILGKVNKGGRFVGQGMTAAAIYGVVLRYEKRLQVKVKPHDLRRTFGKLAHQGGPGSSRFSALTGTPRSKLPNATWESSRIWSTLPVITCGWLHPDSATAYGPENRSAGTSAGYRSLPGSTLHWGGAPSPGSLSVPMDRRSQLDESTPTAND